MSDDGISRVWILGPKFRWRESVKLPNGRRHTVTRTGQHPAPKGNTKIARVIERPGRRPLAIMHPHPRTEAAEEALVRALLVHPRRPGRPLSGPLRLDVEAVLAVPTGYYAWKREAALAGAIPPLAKAGKVGGDRGNYLKLVEDALERAGWIAGDELVVEGEVSKRFGPEPGYMIDIARLPAPPESAREWRAWTRG